MFHGVAVCTLPIGESSCLAIVSKLCKDRFQGFRLVDALHGGKMLWNCTFLKNDEVSLSGVESKPAPLGVLHDFGSILDFS